MVSSWVLLGSVGQALLQLLGVVLYTYIVFTSGASGLVLGLLAMLWSLVFFLANRLFLPLSAAAHNKLLAFIAFASMGAGTASWFLVGGFTGSAIAFLLHSVSSAALSVSLGLTSMEYVDYEYWVRIDVVERIIGLLFAGATLFAMGRGLVSFTPWELLVVSSAVLLAYYLFAPPAVLDFERRYYRLNRHVTCVRAYSRAISVLSYIGTPRLMEIAYSRIRERMPRYLSPWRVSLGAMLATAVGEYIFAVLPVNLRDTVTLSVLWQGYGLAALATALALAPIAATQKTEPRIAGALSLLRGLGLALFFYSLRSVTDIAIYAAFSSIVYNIVDTILANYYVDAAYARMGPIYGAVKQLGAIIGPLLAAILYATPLFTPTAIALAILSMIVLL
ncbi:hypothetical protein PYJP_01870 [Pyrofollis japonicus]|uniref:hypothetical protein n=1 Tax=Pyrofollis japonicus TaxID=3060460 RepID=UPI00295AB6BB|nr:hypothetical protein [Pyrofollis japonicus]BEP16835.1 hypothetical protein PYJP_01870 [Pyrofollis japonicus]